MGPVRAALASVVVLLACAGGLSDAQTPREPISLLLERAERLSRAGDYWTAEQPLREALGMLEEAQSPDQPGLARVLNLLGLNLTAQGLASDAEPLLRRALAIRETAFGPNSGAVANSLNNLAVNLYDQGKMADAEALLRRVVAIRLKKKNGLREIGRSLSNLASILDAQGLHDEAERHHRRALTAYDPGVGRDPAHPPLDTTVHAADRTFQVYRGRLNDRELAIALNNFGENLFQQGKLAEAEGVLRHALLVMNGDDRGKSLDNASIAENLAKVLLANGQTGPALSVATSAFDSRKAAEDLLPPDLSEAAQLAPSQHAGRGAFLVVRLAWRAAQESPGERDRWYAQAFNAVQRMYRSSSEHALAQGTAGIIAENAGAGEVVTAWREAQHRLADIDMALRNTNLLGADGARQLATLAEQRATAVATLIQAQSDVDLRFPRYFALQKPHATTVAELQGTGAGNAALLRPDEALVLLTPGNDDDMPEGARNGLVFVITREQTAWAEIPLSPTDLAREITAIHATLENSATTTPGSPLPAFDRTRALALYRALFSAPAIHAALDGKTRWLIAPQGVLMSLPFAALVTEAPPGGSDGDATPKQLRNTAWLGLVRTLTILPSVSTLHLQRLQGSERPAGARTPFFGVGDPAFAGVADDRPAGTAATIALSNARSYFRGPVADLTRLSTLPRLRGTSQEIRTLAQSLGAGPESYVLQLDATEAELRRRNASGALEQAEIIAFATHGLIAGDLQNLAEPALALTPPVMAPEQSPSPENDGLLTASEAATLTLSARFVILSACNTASSGKPDADALSGLARSFFYAGAQSLLVSHYPVNDTAAMRLTTEAARIAREKGLPNPEAMRQSMLALLLDESADAGGHSLAHPAMWAPFAIVDAN